MCITRRNYNPEQNPNFIIRTTISWTTLLIKFKGKQTKKKKTHTTFTQEKVHAQKMWNWVSFIDTMVANFHDRCSNSKIWLAYNVNLCILTVRGLISNCWRHRCMDFWCFMIWPGHTQTAQGCIFPAGKALRHLGRGGE